MTNPNPVLLGAIAALLSVLPWAAAQNPDQLVREGLLALGAGKYAEARDKLEAVSEVTPEDGRIWLALARIYELANNASKAEDSFTKAAALAPQQPEISRTLAIYFEQLGRFNEAAEWESRFGLARPDDPDTLARTASYYLQANLPAQAVKFAERALEQRETGAIHNLLGKSYSEAGRTDDAARALSRSIELDPYNEEFHYDRGYAYLRVNRFDEAIAAFDESRKLFDRSPRIELGAGIAHYATGGYNQAIEAFLRVSEMSPGDAQPHYFLGQTLLHASGHIDAILRRFDAFRKSQPQNHLGPFLYARGLVAAMDPTVMEQAEPLLRESLALREDFWESHFALGVWLEATGRYDEAESSLLRAEALNPNASKIQEELSRVYTHLGKTELAEEATAKSAKFAGAEQQVLSDSPQAALGAIIE